MIEEPFETFRRIINTGKLKIKEIHPSNAEVLRQLGWASESMGWLLLTDNGIIIAQRLRMIE